MTKDRRTSSHLAREWLRERWALLLSGALLLASIVVLGLRGIPSLAISTLGVIGSVVLFAVDIRNNRERRRELYLVETQPSFRGARPPLAHPGARLIPLRSQLRAEHVLVDPALDVNLHATPVPISVVPDRFALDQELRGYRPYILRDRKGTVRFDGRCVRLGTDLSGELLGRPAAERSVQVQVVGYFDLLSSNYLAPYEVCSRRSSEPLLRGIDLVLDQDRRVRPLTDSRLANVIGVSTLAMTRDRHLVTVIQAPGNNSSARLRAPAGSGSADDRDLPGAATLQEVVVHAMERELGEEINLAGVGAATRIIGYNRWLEKGAKPEFTGITVLDTEARLIRDRPIRRDERDLVARVETHEVDPSRLRLLGESQVRGVPVEVSRGASVPLLIALRCLAVAIAEEPDMLDRLFELARQDARAARR